MSIPVLNDVDFHNAELLGARIQNVSDLPAGLDINDKGRIVIYKNMPYIWNGWRWLGISSNKLVKKGSIQNLSTNNPNWTDDNEIVFNVDPDELYKIDFNIKIYADVISGQIEHFIKFSHSTQVLNLKGEVHFWTGLQTSNTFIQIDYQNSLSNVVTNTDGYFLTHYSGILSTIGDTQSGLVKLQHKVTAGNIGSAVQLQSDMYLSAIRMF